MIDTRQWAIECWCAALQIAAWGQRIVGVVMALDADRRITHLEIELASPSL